MYSFSSTVRYSECDTNSVLTIPSLINYLQDCSTFHTESIGHGISYCNERHFAWYVAAWQVQIERLPRFTEKIVVSTWSNANTVTLANRFFSLKTSEGEELVRADSLWFAFDTHAGRAIRIPEHERVYFSNEDPIDLPPTKRKLKLFGDGMTLEPIVVAEHHLDTNHHVNNGQYIAMADYVCRAQDEAFCPYRLCVQYKNAAKLGDIIIPTLYVEERGYSVDLANTQGVSYAIVRMERR